MAPPPLRRWPGWTWLIALCAAGAFVSATAYRLDRAGLYYDEVHQATGAFAYVGKPSGMFSRVPILGLPTLNMPYSGAVKTGIYGVYLRATGRAFSIVTWRALGILFAAVAVLGFAVATADRLGRIGLVVCLGLLVTDVNLLIQVRHDWGPVALGFALRLALLAVWLAPGDRWSRRRWFALGAVAGLAVFEKLSAVVLLVPLTLIVVTERRGARAVALRWLAGGLAAGLAPLLAVNLYTVATGAGAVALSYTSPREHSLAEHAWLFLTVGNGALEQDFIYGLTAFWWTPPAEGLAIIVCSAAIAWLVVTGRATGDVARAGTALAAYATIAVTLYALPANTAENHWILGTPFHYVAMALAVRHAAVAGLASRALRMAIIAGVAVIVAARVPPLLAVGEAIRTDHYAAAWDPRMNVLFETAAARPNGAVFIAADWGTAAQVFCLANGRQDFVYEPFWSYQGAESLAPILAPPSRREVVVAWRRGVDGVRPAATAAILRDLAVAAGWVEVPVEPELQVAPAIEVRQYRRVVP